MIEVLLWATIGLITVFAVTNGMKDGANVAATAVGSRSLGRGEAILIVALAEFLGPYLLGTRVAETVANNIIHVDVLDHDARSMLLIMSGVLGAILWNGLSLYFSLPTSSSFTLIGGLIGPALFEFGLIAVPWRVFFLKVILAMILSPLLGILVGLVLYSAMQYLAIAAGRNVNEKLKKTQIATLIFLGVNHGTNDSQKAMGIMALALFVAGAHPGITVPLWVKFISISAITLGVTLGGTKIIKTVGYGIFKISPLHSLESQVSAAGILMACNAAGAPVSTTQIISSAVVGVGSGFRHRAVRWGIIQDILWSWLLTIPLAALFSTVVYILLKSVLL